jgi:hypothetical protein
LPLLLLLLLLERDVEAERLLLLLDDRLTFPDELRLFVLVERAVDVLRLFVAELDDLSPGRMSFLCIDGNVLLAWEARALFRRISTGLPLP